MMEDDFGPGAFGMHPHRGFETITFVTEGQITHHDSKGNGGSIHAGDIQFMTAGRGVLHVEEPPAKGRVHLFQLWLNLPAADKMTEVRYQDLRHDKVPHRMEDGAQFTIYSGSSAGIVSPALNHHPVTLLEARIQAGTTVRHDLTGSATAFIHVLSGEGQFGADRTTAQTGQTLWLQPSSEATTAVSITAASDLRIFLAASEPLQEPIAAYGPFVMNTPEQLDQAIKDFQQGRFDA